MSPPTRPTRDEGHLATLLSEVNRARSAFRDIRERQRNQTQRLEEYHRASELAAAMGAYADAAAASGVPLPYRYRDEMRLYQGMADNNRESQRRERL